jgi:arylsulfatase A-like enzyme
MNIIPVSEGSYYKNIEASMTLANAYLQKLKDAGVYDNSAIIIMADHGSRILGPGEDDLYKFNPIFMVKGIGEEHPYQVNYAPLSYEDLIQCYERLMDHKQSTECFDWKEGDHRVRRLIWSAWQMEHHMIEYTLDGYAWEYEKLFPTGREFNR